MPLVCSWLGVATGNPRQELAELLCYTMRLALDPAVSEDAHNMVTGKSYWVNTLGFVYLGKTEKDRLVVEKQYYPPNFPELDGHGVLFTEKLFGPYYNFAAAKKEASRQYKSKWECDE